MATLVKLLRTLPQDMAMIEHASVGRRVTRVRDLLRDPAYTQDDQDGYQMHDVRDGWQANATHKVIFYPGVGPVLSESKQGKTANSSVNYQARAAEFQVGDAVFPMYGDAWADAGRVVAVYPGIGMVDVEFPIGNMRLPVEDVQRLDSQTGSSVPPATAENVPGGVGSGPVTPGPVSTAKKLAQRLAGYVDDLVRDFIVGRSDSLLTTWAHSAKNPSIVRALRQAVRDLSDPEFRALYEKANGYALPAAQQLLRDVEIFRAREAASAPLVSRVASAFVNKSLATASEDLRTGKVALYWADVDRKYKATRSEQDERCYYCPKCRDEQLQGAVYTRENGSSVRLLGCHKCLFLIRKEDVFGHHDFIEMEEV